jgi:hypothetical protein
MKAQIRRTQEEIGEIHERLRAGYAELRAAGVSTNVVIRLINNIYWGLYHGCPEKKIPNLISPFRRSKGSSLTAEQLKHNKRLHRVRQIVERFFGRMKKHLNIVGTVCRGVISFMMEIWLIVVWLTDLHVARLPMNAADDGRGDGPVRTPDEDPQPIEARPTIQAIPATLRPTRILRKAAAARGEATFPVDKSYGNWPFAARVLASI